MTTMADTEIKKRRLKSVSLEKGATQDFLTARSGNRLIRGTTVGRNGLCACPVFLFYFTLIAAVSTGLSGCRGVSGNRPQIAAVSDLTDSFSSADPDTPNAHLKRHLLATRRGLRRDALILIAPVTVRAALPGASGKMTLQGWAAPIFNIGDGFQMDIFLIRAGKSRHVVGRYFDPGRVAEDRNWIPIEVALDIREKDRLEIEISAGSQGDLTADWLALSSLRLIEGKVEP
jgi:hypothetical protein